MFKSASRNEGLEGLLREEGECEEQSRWVCLGEKFLSAWFWCITGEASWNSAVLGELGCCSEMLISSWWMDSMRTTEWCYPAWGKEIARSRKSSLPALGCLAFLLMASCMSQLPNAFPQCGNRMYSVFPSREFTQAVFLCYYQGSPLLDVWQGKRQSLWGRKV